MSPSVSLPTELAALIVAASANTKPRISAATKVLVAPITGHLKTSDNSRSPLPEKFYILLAQLLFPVRVTRFIRGR